MAEPRTYDLPPFLGEPQPVELLTRLLGVRVEGARVTLDCATRRYVPQLQDYYGTAAETVLHEPVDGPTAQVVVEAWSPSVLRLRSGGAVNHPEDDSPMLVGQPESDVDVTVEEHDDRVVVTTTGLRLDVLRDPWQLVVRNPDGAVVWETRPVDLPSLRRQPKPWEPEQQRWLFLHRYAYPWGRTVGDGRRAAFASFRLRHDEHVYGFGEGFGRLDKAGTSQRLWIQEAFSNASPAAYKQVPFWVSSAGHGVFAHTSNPVEVHVGSREASATSVVVDEADGLDLFVTVGGVRDVLPRYTALTGTPRVPPPWSFGLWMGRITYDSQEQVLQAARGLREHRIPCDVMHVDTGWFARDYVCDLEFSPERFPDPAGMCAELDRLGFKVCLWQWPNYTVDSSLFDEGRTAGHLARRPSGHTATVAGGYGEDAGILDVSHPDAVRWYQSKLAALFDLGVAAIKADYGEGAPPTARYAGVDAAAMHNRYPLLYQRAVWDATAAARGADDTVIWARAGWAGAQRYPVHWSGDGVARFEDLACVLRATLSIGLSGFPFYAHDIGGFSGIPDPELYVRWAQLALLSSHARAHGTPPREPWEYGREAEGTVRRYVELRYRLLPYLLSEAVRCGRTSLAMVRSLFVEFPDDPVAWDVDDQYLLGDRLLVAPVLEAGAANRRVYLPPGDWFDYWTKERVVGGRHLDVDAPLDVIPVFVRAGSLLPYGPVQQHVGERRLDPLLVEAYGVDGEAAYDIRAGVERVDIRVRPGAGGLDLVADGAPGAVEAIGFGCAGPLRVVSG